jgi:serine/threonine-protein kinase RsbW
MLHPFSDADRADDPEGAIVEVIGHDRGEAEALVARLLGAAADCGYDEAMTFAFRLAFEEAISNAIRHGNQYHDFGRVEVAWDVDERRIYIRITDQGAGFSPDNVTDPTLDENLSNPAGRGLLLMRAYMTRVVFSGRGHSVAMVLARAI